MNKRRPTFLEKKRSQYRGFIAWCARARHPFTPIFESDFELRLYFKDVLAIADREKTGMAVVNRAALAQLLALAERPHD